MKKFLVIIMSAIVTVVCAFTAVGCNSVGQSEISGSALKSSPYIKWVGRYEYSDSESCVYTHFTATGFTVKFTGSELSVSYKATNTDSDKHRPYFAVSVDGKALKDGKQFCLTQENQTVKVAENLPDGEHIVTVLKRSEPENSLTAITGISTDGRFLENEENLPKFQILGGSGITGHGCLGGAGEEWTTANSTPFESFGYLVASEHGAETQFVSASGMGLVWGYRGVESLIEAYDSAGLVAKYNADGSTSCVSATKAGWNHSVWKPDVIIANIGGNDWNSHISLLSGTERSLAETTFKNAVTMLVNKIFNLYPEVRIVWTATSFTSGNGKLASDAISKIPQKDRVTFVEIDNSKNGADNHASSADHAKNAELILNAIGYPVA